MSTAGVTAGADGAAPKQPPAPATDTSASATVHTAETTKKAVRFDDDKAAELALCVHLEQEMLREPPSMGHGQQAKGSRSTRSARLRKVRQRAPIRPRSKGRREAQRGM
eukprot:252705-Prymnesium_polylepis.1